MRTLVTRISALAGTCATIVACSGSSTTLAPEADGSSDATNGTDAGGGTEGGMGCPSCEAGSTDSGGGSDGSGNDSASPATDSSTDSGGDAAVDSGGETGAGNPCPDVTGSYTVSIVKSGSQGCADLSASAPQCITQTTCDLAFASVVTTGGPAVNGAASLQNDGSFMGAALSVGTEPRTGCTGSWDSGSSTMTVICGGAAEGCTLSLVRKSTKCN
jgi:hypothetical protein